MFVINLTPVEKGVYIAYGGDNITSPPDGCAYLPDDMERPSTFPRMDELEAEEITYTYDVEVEKDGEAVIEKRERTMLTVTKMTEYTGEIPEPSKPEPTENELQWQAITDLEIAQMEYDQALTDLEIAQLEG